MIDLEREHVDRGLFVARRFGSRALATDDEPAHLRANIERGFFNASEFHANDEVLAATKRIDRRSPSARDAEMEKLRLRDLDREFTEATFQFVEIAK